MITDEHIICTRCKYDEWWRSRTRTPPRAGAVKKGWALRGERWVCPYCRGWLERPNSFHRSEKPKVKLFKRNRFKRSLKFHRPKMRRTK